MIFDLLLLSQDKPCKIKVVDRIYRLDSGACFGSLAVTIQTGFLNTSIHYGKLFTFRSVSFIVPLRDNKFTVRNMTKYLVCPV